MKHGIRTAITCVGLTAWAGLSLAQHQGHQMGTGSAGGGPCLAHAKEGLRIVERADRQLEEARQTNSPQQMRAAMNDLQAALGEVRTQLSLCASSAADNPGMEGMEGMEGMDHSGMKGMDHSAMEGMQGMDHGTALTETKDSKPPKGPRPARRLEGSGSLSDGHGSFQNEHAGNERARQQG